MKLRKIIITALSVAMVMSFTACGDSASTNDSAESATTAETVAEAAEETSEETAEPETSEEESTVADDSQTEAADSAENTDSTEASEDETSENGASEGGAPAGDGLMSEEDLQKGWAWTNSLGFSVFYKTYDEIAEYFGVDGELVLDEYTENIKRNRRVYKWISKDDDTHYIWVQFEEKDAENNPGVFTLVLIRPDGFDPAEAEEKYGDEVKEK